MMFCLQAPFVESSLVFGEIIAVAKNWDCVLDGLRLTSHIGWRGIPYQQQEGGSKASDNCDHGH